MARLGIPPHVADKILNHQAGTISGVAAVYQRHDFLAERKEAWIVGAHTLSKLSGRLSQPRTEKPLIQLEPTEDLDRTGGCPRDLSSTDVDQRN